VPLFPLPNTVLFPQTVLPLHVFEPRYKEMTERALEGERLIGMALLKAGWEPEYYGNPEVHDVVGIGRIMHERRTDDGRYTFLLYGVARARVVETVSEHPYRTARVEVLRDRFDAQDASLNQKRLGLLAVYTALVRNVIRDPAMAPEVDIPLGALCDVLAMFAEGDVRDKQAVLEELDVAARVERVVELLRKSPVSAMPFSGKRKLPEPGMN